MTLSALKRLQQTLVEPPALINDIAIRHKSRLLNIFLLILIIVFLGVDGVYLATVPGYIPPWYGYVFLFGSYALNRIGFYRLSALLTLIMFPLVIFVNIVSGESSTPLTMIYYLIPGLMLAGILLPFKLTALFAVVEITIVASMPIVVPKFFAGLESIVGPLSALGIAAVLVLVSIYHRNTIEAERQELLRKSEERYRLVSSVISDYSFSNTRNEKNEFVLDWVAGAFEQISGYTADEFNARGGWLATVHPDDLARDAHDMELLFQNQRVVTELRTIHKDGSVRWVRSYAHPIWDPKKNQLAGIYGAVQDITEQKHIEQERENLINELEAKNAELEQFTYTVSHDLKAPIITIKGFLGFLSQDAHSGNIQRLESDLVRIGEATDKMQKLLNDLLELSRIGRVMNPPDEVDFGELVSAAREILQGRLQERGVEVLVKGDLPVVYGDPQRLLEVVQNLLDNAAKFMGEQPQPGIVVGQVDAANEGYATLYVRDNGVGIAPQYHERIFGLFNRLNPNIEGTGVGLALVKRIIEFHGGRVWVESEAGEGAAFYFTLPLPPSSEAGEDLNLP